LQPQHSVPWQLARSAYQPHAIVWRTLAAVKSEDCQEYQR